MTGRPEDACGALALSERLDPELAALWSSLGIHIDDVDRRSLPIFPEATALTVADTAASGRDHLMTAAAAAAWRTMRAAAAGDGIAIHIISAFRSVARQGELIATKLGAGQALPDILRVLAPPGCSEHHTGRAIDIGSGGSRPLETSFENTAAFHWLSGNAQAFGFSLSYPADNPWGYQYEPWHWCHRA